MTGVTTIPAEYKFGGPGANFLASAMFAYGTKRTCRCLLANVRFRGDCVAKLDCSWRSGSAVNFGRALVQLSR
jgi:hypothetical protein